MTPFAGYRDAETRGAMVEYVARSRFVSAVVAEAELQTLNPVGLAYVYRDMIESAERSAQAIADYDPLGS